MLVSSAARSIRGFLSPRRPHILDCSIHESIQFPGGHVGEAFAQDVYLCEELPAGFFRIWRWDNPGNHTSGISYYYLGLILFDVGEKLVKFAPGFLDRNFFNGDGFSHRALSIDLTLVTGCRTA